MSIKWKDAGRRANIHHRYRGIVDDYCQFLIQKSRGVVSLEDRRTLSSVITEHENIEAAKVAAEKLLNTD